MNTQHNVKRFIMSFLLMFSIFYGNIAYSPFSYSVFTPYKLSSSSPGVPLSRQISTIADISEHKAKKYSLWIEKAVEEMPMKPETLAALVMRESTYKEKAKSKKGAIGLAQVKKSTFKHHCKGKELAGETLTSVSIPKHNVYCAAIVLEDYRIKNCNGSEDCAIRSYLTGPTALKTKPNMKKVSKKYLQDIRKYEMMLSSNAHTGDNT